MIIGLTHSSLARGTNGGGRPIVIELEYKLKQITSSEINIYCLRINTGDLNKIFAVAIQDPYFVILSILIEYHGC